MSEPALTLERLRNWLNMNQPKRERLCLHLLPLLGEYCDIQPRRPEGGPDGGRDIQAVFQGAILVYGAVGFQNSANDSDSEKKWVKKKFRDDLTAALKTNPSLKAFVFFTNVDATPGEVKDLEKIAAKKGIDHVQIFYRERLRAALDSPAGYGYRLQHLGIEMSTEEQVSFINHLETLRERDRRELSKRHEEIERKLQRLEFLNECLHPIHSILTFVELKRPYSAAELGHFRVVISLQRIWELSAWPCLFVGGRDSYMTPDDQNQKVALYGGKTLIWTKHPATFITNRVDAARTETTAALSFAGSLYRRDPFLTLLDIDKSLFSIYITRPLLDMVQTICLAVNNYAIIGLSHKNIVTAEQVGVQQKPQVEWPEDLIEEEKKVEWMQLFVRNEHTDNQALPPPRRQCSPEIHFTEFTPRRVNVRNARGGSLWAMASLLMK